MMPHAHQMVQRLLYAIIADVTDTRVATGSALGHNYNEVWSNDEGQHWHECTICHEKKETADHSFGVDSR